MFISNPLSKRDYETQVAVIKNAQKNGQPILDALLALDFGQTRDKKIEKLQFVHVVVVPWLLAITTTLVATKIAAVLMFVTYILFVGVLHLIRVEKSPTDKNKLKLKYFSELAPWSMVLSMTLLIIIGS